MKKLALMGATVMGAVVFSATPISVSDLASWSIFPSGTGSRVGLRSANYRAHDVKCRGPDRRHGAA